MLKLNLLNKFQFAVCKLIYAYFMPFLLLTTYFSFPFDKSDISIKWFIDFIFVENICEKCTQRYFRLQMVTIATHAANWLFEPFNNTVTNVISTREKHPIEILSEIFFQLTLNKCLAPFPRSQRIIRE